MKILKDLIKSFLRSVLYAYLCRARLSNSSALRWAEFMKRWPGVFGDHPFRAGRSLSDGMKMRIGLIDVIERNLFVNGEWEPHIAKWLVQFIRPGGIVLDVGANIGYFTLLSSKALGSAGRVIAVEPCQKNLSVLCEHLWLNKLDNVVVLSTAGGDSHVIADIKFPTYNNAGAASLRPLHSVQSQKALVAPLDATMDAYGFDVDVIKIDVEGYELHVLRGLERTINRCSPALIIEVSDAFLRELDSSALELLRYLEALGYRGRRMDERGAEVDLADLACAADGFIPQFDAVFERS